MKIKGILKLDIEASDVEQEQVNGFIQELRDNPILRTCKIEITRTSTTVERINYTTRKKHNAEAQADSDQPTV